MARPIGSGDVLASSPGPLSINGEGENIENRGTPIAFFFTFFKKCRAVAHLWKGSRYEPAGQHGFTLMEMLTVVAIMGILASIAMPSYQKGVIRGREASLKQSLFVLRDVIDQHYADYGRYPESLEELVEKRYIREIPMDPMTKSTTTWILIPTDREGESGIFDVHSGSYKVSLAGEPYNEW